MPEIFERGMRMQPPPHVFADIANISDGMNKFVVDSHMSALNETFANMQKRITELSGENKRLKNAAPSKASTRIEKRFYALTGALNNVPAPQKKFAKKLLDADAALVLAWDNADAEETRIRAIAREVSKEELSKKP